MNSPASPPSSFPPNIGNVVEAIFCYPGLMAVTGQRIAHELVKLVAPLIPRIITEHAHSLTGIDIHPGARIGETSFIDHGTGVVIGETCIIGNNARIDQGVTLGAKSFPLDEHGDPIRGIDRHPIVEDDVTIYSNATITGPCDHREGIRDRRGCLVDPYHFAGEHHHSGARERVSHHCLEIDKTPTAQVVSSSRWFPLRNGSLKDTSVSKFFIECKGNSGCYDSLHHYRLHRDSVRAHP